MKDGNTVSQMEVYLPAYLKGRIPADTDLRDLIGFRIPTQGLNSIESIKVKGFLPAGAGDAIIVPSEIVAKTGSDFDIDKLNLYFPNVFYDRNGNPQYISYREDGNYTTEYKEYVDALVGRFTSRLVNEVGDLSEEFTRVLKREARDILTQEGSNITTLIDHMSTIVTEAQAKGQFKREEKYDSIRRALVQISKDIDADDVNDLEPMSLSEFKKRAIENEISNVQKGIILHPSNFKQLITPISAKQLSEEAKDIREMQGLDREETPTMNQIVERKYLMQVARRFIGGKKAIGITAIHSTFDILSKMSNVSVRPEIGVYRNEAVEIVKTNITMPHNQNENGDVTLSKLTDAENKGNVPETLSQWINAAVDAATDPFMFDLNSGPQTLNVVLYLTMAGVPIKHLTRFMTQPIIIDYIANRQKWESQMMEGNNTYEPDMFGGLREVSKKKFRDGIIAETLKSYTNNVSVPNAMSNPIEEFSVEQLEDNIRTGAKLKGSTRQMSKKYATEQIQLLDNFLRYTDVARKLGDNIRGADYDTRNTGKNTSELTYRLENTEVALNNATLNNYDTLINEGFVTPYHKAVEEIRKILDPLFITLNDPVIGDQFDKLYAILFNEANNLPRDSKIVVVDKFKQDFIVYLMTTRPFRWSNQMYGKERTALPMNTQIDRLFKPTKENGGKTIAHRFDEQRQKAEDEGREMIIFDYLESNIAEREEDTSHIIARSKKLDTLDSNRLTNEWRELFDATPEFARDLAMAAILQYGLQNSPYTFVNLIPFEVYGEIMNSVIEDINGQDNTTKAALYSEYYEQFFLNNYDSNDIVPVLKGVKVKNIHRLYPFYKTYELKDEFATGKDKTKRISEAKGRGVYVVKPKPTIHRGKETWNLQDAIKDYRNGRLLTTYGDGMFSVNEPNTVDTSSDIAPIAQPQNSNNNAPAGTPQFTEDQSPGYAQRTKANASADATIAIAVNFQSAGERLTKRSVLEQGKQYIPVNANTLKVTDALVKEVVDKLNKVNATTLNIAGNGIFTMKGKHTQDQVDAFTYDLLLNVLGSPNLNVPIDSIRTGGQTGFDEAGTKAAMRLGVPNLVLAPKGWKFRNESGTDVSSESRFKGRFHNVEQGTLFQVSSGSKEKVSTALDDKMKQWLTKMGINFQNVENITDRDGVPVNAIAKADMLHAVVQVVEGKADISTLPEETAHFLVELLGDDNPLLKGMMNAVEGTETLREVEAEYSELYGNDHVRLRKEAVGKQIAKAIIRKEKVCCFFW